MNQIIKKNHRWIRSWWLLWKNTVMVNVFLIKFQWKFIEYQDVRNSPLWMSTSAQWSMQWTSSNASIKKICDKTWKLITASSNSLTNDLNRSTHLYWLLPFDPIQFATGPKSISSLVLSTYNNIHRYFQLANKISTHAAGQHVQMSFIKLAAKNFHQSNRRRI